MAEHLQSRQMASFMAPCAPLLLLTLSLCFYGVIQAKPLSDLTSPYLSPATFPASYQKMLKTFKIFAYIPEKLQPFGTAVESLFHDSLLKSSFITTNAEDAHLFYLPFPHDSSRNYRGIVRLIRNLRTDFPFWNRTLGADHFYVSCSGIGMNSDRNIVELKKNSVQISCFPTAEGRFIPHKDVSFPHLNDQHLHAPPGNGTAKYLGYLNLNGSGDQNGKLESTFSNELRGDPQFLVESEASDPALYAERLSSSKFCLFFYGGDVSGIGDALQFGCVPVVITERPILDLPFMDVLRWSEIAVFVGAGGGVEGMKKQLGRTCEGDRYERMKNLAMVAGQHFVWNSSPQPYDAFHTVMYQLWLRRHTIRYARWESI
uniref:Exostosin GT47 domain-containing protein n=1 Tax=Nelumbo nucifera TaxID=4432 RepID=A0A822XUQ5_NELNU|nr:TPA_asm: hypothetical protein HUJ06_024282 [Nelumbo nucifera]